MVNLSCTKDGVIISVKKAVEAEIVDFIKENAFSREETSYEKRINGWIRDFHVSDFAINNDEKTITLIRELNEKESESVDIDMIAQAMRDIMMSFVDFVKSLIKEAEGSHEGPTNSADAEENAPKFFHMDQTENGFTIEGNIHPMKVVVALLAMIKEMVSDENDKND